MKFWRAIKSVLRVVGVLAPGLDAVREEFARLCERIDRIGDRLEGVRDRLVGELRERLGKPLREVAEAVDAALASPALPGELRAKLERARVILSILLEQSGGTDAA